MVWLSDKNKNFPDIENANKDGVLALGGDLSSERLINAYTNGIFPWYSEGEPIIWYSPDPRMVLFFDELKISKSMRKVLRDKIFTVTFNTAFEEVIYQCKSIERGDGLGTWITDDMQNAYIELHKKGIAKSVEVWCGEELVGGLYGVDLGDVFCGESMFSKKSNASKVAFISLAQKLEKENYKLIDCQVYNDHLASLGAEEIPRAIFRQLLEQ
ncbi:leucyl/phenylalanyl-tRNA--protein transferase [Flavicella sediminum]|uniref:leucyl/phenylalanyl-tRNA--protein transferase n=1 Tax=Flavicella sediminum TaxID=2585141 RepID=UPI001120CC01|nr:leucyl/phenylalanyl-tRNA--protein transferase [Flavicella sediminum]